MKFNSKQVVKLLQVKGIGRGKIFNLSNRSSQEVKDDYELAELVVQNIFTLKIPTTTKNEILIAFEKAEELYHKSIGRGIEIISYSDSKYPLLLREIDTPPAILSVVGNIEALSKPSIAVIGTRQPSDHGKSVGERIGYRLGESGINVVSGLAVGCDTAAHIGCLRANGTTTAVMAHGLDHIYPKENQGLAQSIIENGGCLVSEYLLGVRGLPNFFIERDRIQAGLSKGTIVIETDIKGGTMHTVGNTIDYKRILAVYSHPVDKRNDKSRGNEMLENDGTAIGIRNLSDIETLINSINPRRSIIEPSNEASIDTIQLPVFDLESLIVKDYQYITPKKKRKKSNTDDKSDNTIQKELYE